MGKVLEKKICESCIVSRHNPFVYKGYFLDEESNMYYCKSRYYVPDWCRWLNADNPNFLDTESLTDMNLFAYCGNNPILGMDTGGNFTIFGILVSVAISLVAEVIEDVITDGKLGGDKTWKDYVGAGASGLISGFGGGFLTTLAASTAASFVDAKITGDAYNPITDMVGTALGYGAGKAFGKVGKKIASKAKARSIQKAMNKAGAKKANSVGNKLLNHIGSNGKIGLLKKSNGSFSKNLSATVFNSKSFGVFAANEIGEQVGAFATNEAIQEFGEWIVSLF